MNNLITELEKFQAQFSDYGTILLKIMLRKEKEKEYVLKNLIEYLKKNPEVTIVNLRQEAGLIAPIKELRFILSIKFECSSCTDTVEEETDIKCTWIPHKAQGEYVCQNCIDSQEDNNYDAMEEQRYLEEEEMRDEGKWKYDEGDSSHDLEKKKHEED